jgi:O-antigen ligase
MRVQQVALGQLRISDALNGTVTSANFSTVERLAHWIAGLRMFVTHPVLGVGAGNYDVAYAAYALPDWPDALGHAHNYYINVAAETGILGFVAFFALTAAALYLGWYVVRYTGLSGALPSSQRALALGLFGAIVALAVHNLTDDLFVHAMELQFALTLGCLIALLRMNAARQSS